MLIGVRSDPLDAHYSNSVGPVEEAHVLPELQEILLYLPVHLSGVSVSQHDNAPMLPAGVASFEELMNEVQRLLAPSQDQDMLSKPHSTLGSRPGVLGASQDSAELRVQRPSIHHRGRSHGRANPLYLSQIEHCRALH